MNPECIGLLGQLSADEPVSGEVLAKRLGVTRGGVWKRIEALRAAGVEIRGRAGGGYRLAWPVDLLDAGRIAGALAAEGIATEVHPVLESTNTTLAIAADVHRRLVTAEYQSAGRGRRGRSWLSPPAAGIYLSFGFRFQSGLPALGPLSLVAGLAVARALEANFGVSPGLKWPNDLVIGGYKLGGLLTEISGAADGPCLAVIGLGLNVRLPPNSIPDQPWTDLYRAVGAVPDRSELAIALTRALDRACRDFQGSGFESFKDAWARLDVLAGNAVEVRHLDGRAEAGIAEGVSDQGALLFNGPAGRLELAAGEVTVRGP